MNRLPDSPNGSIVPYTGLPCPDGFDVGWAGEFSVPDRSIPPLICLGSLDGKLLFTNQEFSRLQEGKGLGSGSGEAINGVARSGTWAAVSTRKEVSFWATTKPQGLYLPHGAHGVSSTPGGYFIAPLGKAGILTATPLESEVSLMAHTPGDGNLNVYRALSLRSQGGTDVLACAARSGGMIAGFFSASEEANPMRIANFHNVDVIDICALSAETDPLAVAILGRDGSIILCRDVLNERRVKTFKFQSIKGVAYRILSHLGDIYVLTSRGLYILGRLGSRFLNGETMEGVTTPVMPLDLAAIDMNLVWGRWLLVVLANEVRKFDADLIHDFVPQHIGEGEIQELQSIAPPMESEWSEIHSTTESLAVAS